MNLYELLITVAAGVPAGFTLMGVSSMLRDGTQAYEWTTGTATFVVFLATIYAIDAVHTIPAWGYALGGLSGLLVTVFGWDAYRTKRSS